MSDAGVEAARKLASRFTTVGSEQWHLLVQAIAAHTEAALVQDRIARAHAATADMEAYAAGQVEAALAHYEYLRGTADST